MEYIKEFIPINDSNNTSLYNSNNVFDILENLIKKLEDLSITSFNKEKDKQSFIFMTSKSLIKLVYCYYIILGDNIKNTNKEQLLCKLPSFWDIFKSYFINPNNNLYISKIYQIFKFIELSYSKNTNSLNSDDLIEKKEVILIIIVIYYNLLNGLIKNIYKGGIEKKAFNKNSLIFEQKSNIIKLSDRLSKISDFSMLDLSIINRYKSFVNKQISFSKNDNVIEANTKNTEVKNAKTNDISNTILVNNMAPEKSTSTLILNQIQNANKKVSSYLPNNTNFVSKNETKTKNQNEDQNNNIKKNVKLLNNNAPSRQQQNKVLEHLNKKEKEMTQNYYNNIVPSNISNINKDNRQNNYSFVLGSNINTNNNGNLAYKSNISLNFNTIMSKGGAPEASNNLFNPFSIDNKNDDYYDILKFINNKNEDNNNNNNYNLINKNNIINRDLNSIDTGEEQHLVEIDNDKNNEKVIMNNYSKFNNNYNINYNVYNNNYINNINNYSKNIPAETNLLDYNFGYNYDLNNNFIRNKKVNKLIITRKKDISESLISSYFTSIFKSISNNLIQKNNDENYLNIKNFINYEDKYNNIGNSNGFNSNLSRHISLTNISNLNNFSFGLNNYDIENNFSENTLINKNNNLKNNLKCSKTNYINNNKSISNTNTPLSNFQSINSPGVNLVNFNSNTYFNNRNSKNIGNNSNNNNLHNANNNVQQSPDIITYNYNILSNNPKISSKYQSIIDNLVKVNIKHQKKRSLTINSDTYFVAKIKVKQRHDNNKFGIHDVILYKNKAINLTNSIIYYLNNFYNKEKFYMFPNPININKKPITIREQNYQCYICLKSFFTNPDIYYINSLSLNNTSNNNNNNNNNKLLNNNNFTNTNESKMQNKIENNCKNLSYFIVENQTIFSNSFMASVFKNNTLVLNLIDNKIHWCSYLLKYVCSNCISDELSIIPAFILSKWNFNKFSISKYGLSVIKYWENKPVIHIKSKNPIINFSSLLKQAITIKRKIHKIFDIMICNDKEKFIEAVLVSYNYLVFKENYFSLADLSKINDISFISLLNEFFSAFENHILNDCKICKYKGDNCFICNKDEILYAYNVESTIYCHDCKKIYHKRCASVHPCLVGLADKR